MDVAHHLQPFLWKNLGSHVVVVFWVVILGAHGKARQSCLTPFVLMLLKDYGPFGFMEEYDPAWCMWVGGGGHFAFGSPM